MSLQEFRDLLLGITEKAYHFEAAQDAPDKYIVWQETGSRALLASYCRQEVIHELRVDFYTEEEYDPMPEQILKALEDAGIAVPEQTIVYDTNTRRICYSMKCEMAG